MYCMYICIYGCMEHNYVTIYGRTMKVTSPVTHWTLPLSYLFFDKLGKGKKKNRLLSWLRLLCTSYCTMIMIMISIPSSSPWSKPCRTQGFGHLNNLLSTPEYKRSIQTNNQTDWLGRNRTTNHELQPCKVEWASLPDGTRQDQGLEEDRICTSTCTYLKRMLSRLHLLSSLTCRGKKKKRVMADSIAQTRAVLAALPLCAVSHTTYARQ